ncbi:MAG: rod-binding protein [Planctomycetota bacterium]
MSVGPVQGPATLEALRAGRIEDPDARLRATADLLEGVFYQELFKAMRETVPESGLTGDNSQEIFSSMMDQHVAESAAARTADGLAFIPAASGRDELTRLSHGQFAKLLRQLVTAAQAHDLLILDTMAGISSEVTTFLRASAMVVVVLTPDPTSLTDAYALIKVLESQQPGKDIRVIVNQAGSDDEALRTYQRLQKVVRTYLQRELQLLGHLPRDRHVTEAVRARTPFAHQQDSPASQALRGIALRLKAFEWHT